MWLRSEKRASRLTQSTKSAINLKKAIKASGTLKNFKNAGVTNRKGSQQNTGTSCRNSDSKQSQIKCNSKIRSSVKRLGKKSAPKRCDRLRSVKKSATTTSGRRMRNSARNLSHSGKENCWQDGAQEDITLYAMENVSNCANITSNAKVTQNDIDYCGDSGAISESGGLTDDDALNSFGPIVLNTTTESHSSVSNIDGSASNSPCHAIHSQYESCNSTACISTSSPNDCDKSKNTTKKLCVNYIKCISECDSTTDYERKVLPSTSTTVSPNSSTGLNTIDAIDAEIDSTTDLLPADQLIADASELQGDGTNVDQLKSKDLPKLTLVTPCANDSFHEFPTPDLTPSSKQFPLNNNNSDSGSSMAEAPNSHTAIAGSSSVPTFPSTPDLISLFDEEINKGSADMCQYSDFFPYNNVITQALLSCNEMNSLCEQNDLTNNLQTDITFLSSMNQTAIDNLKALSNLQNHTTNFLSGITLPKTSYNETMASDDDGNIIHSVVSNNCTSYSQTQMMVQHQDNVNQQQHDQNGNGNEIQLETDECMEIEEINERQEELAWDAFDPYVFIKHLPPLTAEMRAKCPALPLKTRSSPEFNLVLDLDETLVHCSLQELSDASFKFPVLFQVNLQL